jgi:hypothetical protein
MYQEVKAHLISFLGTLLQLKTKTIHGEYCYFCNAWKNIVLMPWWRINNQISLYHDSLRMSYDVVDHTSPSVFPRCVWSNGLVVVFCDLLSNISNLLNTRKTPSLLICRVHFIAKARLHRLDGLGLHIRSNNKEFQPTKEKMELKMLILIGHRYHALWWKCIVSYEPTTMAIHSLLDYKSNSVSIRNGMNQPPWQYTNY